MEYAISSRKMHLSHRNKITVIIQTQNNHTLKGRNLEWVNSAKYRGTVLPYQTRWHDILNINNITAKANKISRFLKRNLKIKQEETKCLAYKSMVRSNLEYYSSICSPHTKKLKNNIEKVQRRTTRYDTNRYHNTSIVSFMIDHLNWKPCCTN